MYKNTSKMYASIVFKVLLRLSSLPLTCSPANFCTMFTHYSQFSLDLADKLPQ